MDKVGAVAYKFQLPTDVEIHNVFHVSYLKLAYASIQSSGTLPQWVLLSKRVPQAIQDQWMVKHQNTTAAQVLIQWQGFS